MANFSRKIKRKQLIAARKQFMKHFKKTMKNFKKHKEDNQKFIDEFLGDKNNQTLDKRNL